MKAQRWADHGFVTDRFILDDIALAKWLGEAFGIREREEAMKRITEIDALAERIVVDGTDYQIPDHCYERMIKDKA